MPRAGVPEVMTRPDLGAARAEAERRLAAPQPYDFDESVRFLCMGRFDPTCRRGRGEFWKAGHTPHGPVALELRPDGVGLLARGYGPGAGWAVERADALLGLYDDPGGFRPDEGPARLRTLARRGRGLHLPRSPFVFDGLTAVILQQRVAWRDATRAYGRLALAAGARAPGPADLWLPPSPRKWASLSGHDLERAGVDGQRARALRAAAREAAAIDATFALSFDAARALLAAVPGCGPWTVGMTLGHLLGDPDALIPGDLHLPRLVTWALTGDETGPADDERMLQLLEPYRGHRFRLVRLLYAAGLGAPYSTRSRAARSRE